MHEIRGILRMSHSMSIRGPADPPFAVLSDIVDWGRSSSASYIRTHVVRQKSV
jgi:hypothetical protein